MYQVIFYRACPIYVNFESRGQALAAIAKDEKDDPESHSVLFKLDENGNMGSRIEVRRKGRNHHIESGT